MGANKNQNNQQLVFLVVFNTSLVPISTLWFLQQCLVQLQHFLVQFQHILLQFQHFWAAEKPKQPTIRILGFFNTSLEPISTLFVRISIPFGPISILFGPISPLVGPYSTLFGAAGKPKIPIFGFYSFLYVFNTSVRAGPHKLLSDQMFDKISAKLPYSPTLFYFNAC